MKSKTRLALLWVIIVCSSGQSTPAQAQGMMEGTGLSGTAAGVGGGLGAGAYKLFNKTTENAAASLKSVSAAARNQPPTIKEIQAKTTGLTAAAKEKSEVDPVAAAKLWLELAQYRQKQVGKYDPIAAEAYKNAGVSQLSSKQFSQAEDNFKMALSYCNRINGEKSPKSVAILQNLGRSLKEQDRSTEAVPYFKQALELQEKLPHADARSVFTTRVGLGEALYKSGTYADAEPLLKTSVEQGETNNFCGKEEMTSLMDTYAECLRKDNKADEADLVSKKAEALKAK